MKRINTLLFFSALFCLASFSAQSQNFWQDIEVSPSLARFGDKEAWPAKYRTIAVDQDQLQEALRFAPDEHSGAERPVIEIPLPGGGTERFKVEGSPVMAPGLAARYPQIRSFRAISLENKGGTGRFDYGPMGFHATLQTKYGEVFIDPFDQAGHDAYAVYFTRDVEVNQDLIPPMICGYQPSVQHDELLEEIRNTPLENGHARGGADLQDIRIYRLALACTGEYGKFHGNTIPAVLATMVTAVNRLNETFEREVSVRAVLIENNDQLIWLNPDADPYINSDEGLKLLSQNGPAINDIAGIPPTAYDLGHVFTGGCSDVGGVVSGLTCTSGKDRGVTCHSSPNINAIVRRVMTHEVAHQFSASHTFSNCPDWQEQAASGTAFEPGSGTTTMSYAGACGPQNVAFDSDDYYHTASLEQFINYSRFGTGSTCGTLETTDNHKPEITLPYEDGFYIPKSTPFELTASASDEDGDAVSYCWEQFNLGITSNLGSPTGDAPSFRSFQPTASPTRVFPRMNLIVNNQSDIREVLPTYGRALNFRCTVRDNHPGASGAVWEEVGFRSTATAGPFLVTQPNTAAVTWEGGTYQEVTWDVANTDGELVNCKMVNIRLSTDGGYTYPYTLISETPNDGSAMVPVPDITSDSARVRVEGARNIFFDISNADFHIDPATKPGFAVQPVSAYRKICTPTSESFDIESIAYLGFDQPIQLDAAAQFPEGITYQFSAGQIQPGESAAIELSFEKDVPNGLYELPLKAYVDGVDTINFSLVVDLVSTDFSELALQQPINGTDGVGLSATFNWAGSQNAAYYEWEMATSPIFGATTVETASNVAETTFNPQGLFEENVLYYWHVRAVNECGPGPWTEPFTFHTQNVNCSAFQSQDIPKAISGSGLPTVESELHISSQGIISDVNVSYFKATYQPVNSLRVTLISPAGTEVILFNKNCGNTVDIALGFDDDAPNPIACPPDDNIVFKPVEPLAAFIGENTAGTWKMRVKVATAGFGASGALQAWKLEFCAAGSAIPPALIKNDTLYVPPAGANPITKNQLEVLDQDNGPLELTYTIVTPPNHGTLYLAGEPLETGGHFRQSTINAGNLYYEHNGDEALFDDFTFLVEDGTGGWLSPMKFNIRIDENAPVATVEPQPLEGLNLYPNPNNGRFTVELEAPSTQNWRLSLRDLQGRELWSGLLPTGSTRKEIQTNALPDGLYLLHLAGEHDGSVTTRKVLVSSSR